jgi:transportin-3
MHGGQEHELTMRTAELIEDNAQQALELLIRYATSSRTFLLIHCTLVR